MFAQTVVTLDVGMLAGLVSIAAVLLGISWKGGLLSGGKVDRKEFERYKERQIVNEQNVKRNREVLAELKVILDDLKK